MQYCAVPMQLLTFLAFLASQLLITWYGHYMSGIPTKGQFLGIAYASPLVSLFITQIKYLWVPVLINMLYGIGFQWGNTGFGSFLVVITLWIAAAPIAAVLFNAVIVREPIDWPTAVGLLIVTVGAMIVALHEKISALMQ